MVRTPAADASPPAGDQRPTIALVGPGPEARGGIAAALRLLATSALAERYRFVPIRTYREGSSLHKLAGATAALGELAWLLARREIDIVHVNSASGSSFTRKLVAVVLARAGRTPLVFHVHGGGFHRQLTGAGVRGRLRRRSIIWTISHADAVVALTPSWSATISEWTRVRRLRVVPNTPELHPLPRRAAADGTPATIAFVGHLERAKGLFELIDAFQIAHSHYPGTRLVLAGTGPDEVELRRAAARLGPGVVRFPGWIGPDEKASLLAAAACFVLPSHDEGLPLALLEAALAGTPVVASCVGGIPDVVEDGREALLVPPGDVRALAAALLRLLRNPALGARLGAAARARTRVEFGAENAARRMGEVYEELLHPHVPEAHRSQRIYARLPVPLQNAAVSAAGLRRDRARYAAPYDELLAAAESRARWSDDEVSAFRDRRLREHVAYAASNVPHFRRLFAELDVDPGTIKGLADLSDLPLLHKHDMQAAVDRFGSTAVPPGDRIWVDTSGTTGAGLHFATTRRAIQEQWATYWRYRRWHGIERGVPCALLTGHPIVPRSQKAPPFWRFDRPGHQVLFSAFHLRPDTVDAYLDELRRSRPPWLHGYPSFLTPLAARARARGGLGYVPRWVTTCSETLSPQQAATIEQGFGVRPLQHYGLTEGVANASECEHGMLHVDEDFSAVELLPTDEHGVHLVVGTAFTNPATAFLRYDTGDLVTLGGPCGCGRPGRTIAAVEGRTGDYLVLGDGSLLGVTDHLFWDVTCVREAQMSQDRPGAVELRIVRGDAYTPEDEDAVLRRARGVLGSETEVSIAYVERIEPASSGKRPFVRSSLPQDEVLATIRDA